MTARAYYRFALRDVIADLRAAGSIERAKEYDRLLKEMSDA